MAGRKRDVELVIRAKNEAEKVVKAISSAMDDFTQAQRDLSTQAGKTDSALGKLGAAFGNLDKAARDLQIEEKIKRELDAAAASMEALEQGVAETSNELRDLEARAEKSGAALTDMRSKSRDLGDEIERTTGAVKKQKAELRSNTTALNRAEKAQERLASRFDTLNGEIEQNEGKVRDAKTRYAELAAQMNATDKPVKRLVTSFDAAQRRVERTTAALEASKASLVDVRQQQGATASEIDRLRSAISSTEASITQQEGSLKSLSNEHKNLKGSIREAATEDKQLAAALESVTDSLRKQEQQIKDAAQGYDALETAAAQARAQVGALGTASRGNLETVLVQQAQAAIRLREEYRDLRVAADEVATEIGRAGVPTREMAQEMRRVAQAADEAELKFMAQQETVDRLGAIYRGTSDDIASIADAQQKFVREVGRGSAALQELSEDGLKARNALRGLESAENQAAQASGRVADASRNAANARKQELSVLERLRAANRGLYGDSRQSLSFMQRLRGEVLSLAAAYGGLFGAIEAGGQSIRAVGTIEAVNSRLQVANEGNEEQTASDMDYLRRMANRLGVELGTLATEYSKLAIATKGTNLEGEETRKLFRRISEAARVNRSSNEEMQAVFTALTQIVSKGAVQMEELRQQLGDRLPGALQIMADGLGVTTAQLIEMMEQGQVTADALIPFGEEIEKRFGPQLAESLKSSTVQIGRLKNALFEAMLAFGRGGFVDGVTEFAQRVSEVLRSGEFLSFLDRASSAAQGLMQLLAYLIENFQALGIAAGVFVGIKMVPYVFALGAAMSKAGKAAKGLALDMATASAATSASAATAGRATTVFRGLTAAVRTFLASTGVGLAVVAATTALGYFITSTEDSIAVATKHRDIMDEVRNAYEAAGGELDEYQKILAKSSKVTETEIKATIEAAKAALADAKTSMDEVLANEGTSFWNRIYSDSNVTIAFSRATQEIRDELTAVVTAYENGEIALEDYVQRVDEAVGKHRDASAANARYADAAIEAARETVQHEGAIRDLNDALVSVTGEGEQAADAMDRLGRNNDTAGGAAADAAAKHRDFESSLAALRDVVPSLDANMKTFAGTVERIDAAFEAALIKARAMPDAIQRIAAEQAALAARTEELNAAAANWADGAFSSATGDVEAAAILIKEFEGFIGKAAWDVNASRVGYGSDTLTDAQGNVTSVTAGSTTTRAAAERDLRRRITEEFMPIAARAVGSAFDSLLPQQKAVLTSIAYNYGKLPASVAAAVRTGDDQAVVRAIEGLGARGRAGTKDERGARNRTAREAAAYTTRSNIPALDRAAVAEIDAEERAAEQEERRRQREAEADAERARRQREATQERLQDGQFEIEQQERLNAGRERQAEIEEALRDARQADPNITQEELDRIAEMTGRTFDLAEARKKSAEAAKLAEKGTTPEQEAALKAAEAAQREVDNLLTVQKELQSQIELAREAGDQDAVEALRAKLEEVNAQLVTAIANAKQMWDAVGGTAGDAASAKLATAAAETAKLGQNAQEAFIDWKKVGDLFATGLTNAFGSFAQAVAEGKGIGEAARDAFLKFASDFLIQVGQMIVQQAILNALRGAGASRGGILGAMFPAATGHTGGMVGSSRVGSGNSSRSVSPALFVGAPRFHEGGLPGIRPNEVPIIAKKGEEVLSEDDPRNAMNGGGQQGGGGSDMAPMILNAFDAESFMDVALSSPRGRKLMTNFVRANRGDIKSALG